MIQHFFFVTVYAGVSAFVSDSEPQAVQFINECIRYSARHEEDSKPILVFLILLTIGDAIGSLDFQDLYLASLFFMTLGEVKGHTTFCVREGESLEIEVFTTGYEAA